GALRRDGARAVLGLVELLVLAPDVEPGEALADLVDDDDGVAGHDGPFDVLLAELEEARVQYGGRVVDVPREPALDERAVRDRGHGAGGPDEDGVGLGGEDPEHLARHRGVGASEPLVGDHLEAVLVLEGAQAVYEVVAEGIVVADVA